MESIGLFVTNSILLGVGLAADAFSVSVADGINHPKLKKSKMIRIAALFAFFQALMPMTGWFLTHSILKYFHILSVILPFVSQLFLLYIGVKMILDRNKDQEEDSAGDALTGKVLLVQAVATSVDALLVGLMIVSYQFFMAFVCSIIIATVTFVLCYFGVHGGKALGLKFVGKASLFSGLVLIFIAVEHILCCIF